MLKKYSIYLSIILFFLLAFAFRFGADQAPFWVDEFSSGVQARTYLDQGLQVFSQEKYFLEKNNYLTHTLIAVSFALFGESEATARLPIIIVGSLVPVLLYLLLKKQVNTPTALSAAILVSLSYFQITWSAQARGYMIQQLLAIGLVYVYLNYIKESKKQNLKDVLVMFILSILGLLTHKFFIFVIVAVLSDFILSNIGQLRELLFLKNKWLYGFMTLWLVLFAGLIMFIFSDVGDALRVGYVTFHNNLWYYHAFLWREYSLIVFLSLLGWIFLYKKNIHLWRIWSVILVLQLGFVSFFFGHYIAKYTLPAFYILLSLSGVAVYNITKLIPFKNKLILTMLLTIFIIANGNKFVIKPKAFYSVNHDMRDISLVDYDRVYDLIKAEMQKSPGKVAVIDTWIDRVQWYLGSDHQPLYWLRWEDAGFRKQTMYELNSSGDKIIKRGGQQETILVSNLEDLLKVMDQYPKGFIWIDDSSLPADVIQYAQDNYKKELYLDHYPLDDNPYSIWPGTLYSWGID